MRIWSRPLRGRIGVSVLLQLLLLHVFFREMAKWSSVERDIWLDFAATCLAAVGIALLLPLFLKATRWNRVSLCALMVFPAFIPVFVCDRHFRISECFMDWLMQRAGP